MLNRTIGIRQQLQIAVSQNVYKTIMKCIANAFTEIIKNTQENIANSNTDNPSQTLTSIFQKHL